MAPSALVLDRWADVGPAAGGRGEAVAVLALADEIGDVDRVDHVRVARRHLAQQITGAQEMPVHVQFPPGAAARNHTGVP